MKDLEEIQANSQGIVKRSAIRYLEPIRKLHHSQNQMLYNAAVLTCLDFKKINFDLALPTVDECAVNSHINSQRQTILRIHENFIAAYKQVLHMHNLLRQWNISFTETHPLLLMFADTTNIQKVLECDALLAKLPARSRKAPQSVYDKMLGIEYFYEFLRALPAKNDDSVLERVKIRPECISLRELCKQYSGFVTFTELPENKWLLRNNISKLHDYCVSQLDMRDSLIKNWQDECSKTPLVRKAIILRGMIIYFASPQSISKSYISQFVNDFKKFRNPLVVLNNSYDNASPELFRSLVAIFKIAFDEQESPVISKHCLFASLYSC